MRTLVVISLFTACSYTPGVSEQPGIDAAPGDPQGPPGPDAATQPGIDAPPQTACATSDSTLALCLELDDTSPAIAADGSGHAHDASVTNATAATRDVPTMSRALAIGSSTAIMIPDSTDFDLQTLTISAWVRRTGMPASGQRFGIVDFGRKQAAMAVDDQGRIACMVRTAADTWVGSGAIIPASQWTMVACTYDAPELCMYTFANGNPVPTVDCGNTDGELLDTSVNAGGTIGAMFDTSNHPTQKLSGSIDSIRIYGRALTSTQLCTGGGLTGC